MEELGQNQGISKVTLSNRRDCILSGVKDVLAFDIHEVLLETEQGMLTIRGEDLHVSHLNLERGEVNVDGKIDCLFYSDTFTDSHKGGSVWSRLFR